MGENNKKIRKQVLKNLLEILQADVGEHSKGKVLAHIHEMLSSIPGTTQERRGQHQSEPSSPPPQHDTDPKALEQAPHKNKQAITGVVQRESQHLLTYMAGGIPPFSLPSVIRAAQQKLKDQVSVLKWRRQIW